MGLAGPERKQAQSPRPLYFLYLLLPVGPVESRDGANNTHGLPFDQVKKLS
jgi:hypothetical protein